MSYNDDNGREQWYRKESGDVHDAVFAFIRRVENEQGDVYDRLAMLESLYDQYSPRGDDTTDSSTKLLNVSENLVASNIDTVFAQYAKADIRPRYLTDGADWSMQRRAKKCEYYSEGLGKLLDVPAKCKLAAREAPKKGMGVVKVYASAWREPVVEVAQLEDIIVRDCDSRRGAPPMQLHHVQRDYDRDRLMAEYPEHADDIENSYGMRSGFDVAAGYASGYASATNNKLTVIESIRLPIGKRPPADPEVPDDAERSPKKKTARRAADKAQAKYARYVPGRRTVTIANKTLADEPYHKPHYPFAMLAWSARMGSFYPISGAERVVGLQRQLNKRNWQIERVLDQGALMTGYIRPTDANLQVRTTKIGNLAVCKSDYPYYPPQPLVNPETYQDRRAIKESAPEQMGVSQFSTQSAIPAGLETGAAVREYSAKSSERHGPQEAAYEQFILDVHWLLLDVCKDLGAAAPTVLESRWGKAIDWSEVAMDDVRIQIAAASTLPRTAAGREQTVLEWAQAGIISTDSAKRLIAHPDLERELSLYTAALEAIECEIEKILEGGIGTPEPYDNLEMIVWRATASYHNARVIPSCPEEVLEGLRDYIAQAAYFIDQRTQPANANQVGDPAAIGAAAGGPPAPGPPPGAGAPSPAFSPQAMQLRAS